MLTAQKLRFVIALLFFLCILLSLPSICGHSHHHDDNDLHDDEEPPSFKWSKEANEPYLEREDSIEDHDNYEHINYHKGQDERSKSKSTADVWMDAIGSTILISIAPYLILFIIPVTNKKEHVLFLNVLLAFASGGLLGDAFLHLIPHALMAQASASEDSSSHSHSHGVEEHSKEHHSHGHETVIGVSVLTGIIIFLIIEKCVRIFKGGHTHSHVLHNMEVNGKERIEEKKKKKMDKTSPKTVSKASQIAGSGDMKVAGYLNLAADFTHNFTDGLAIGASFLAGRSIGFVTTFTIFLHEIPHEIGDFAILIQSGCSKKKAMCLQLITAVGALCGTCISLMAEGIGGELAVTWILPITAGGFIYIATVSVIPELLENSNFWQSVAEVIALLFGVGLMLAISWIEDMDYS